MIENISTQSDTITGITILSSSSPATSKEVFLPCGAYFDLKQGRVSNDRKGCHLYMNNAGQLVAINGTAYYRLETPGASLSQIAKLPFIDEQFVSDGPAEVLWKPVRNEVFAYRTQSGNYGTFLIENIFTQSDPIMGITILLQRKR